MNLRSIVNLYVTHGITSKDQVSIKDLEEIIDKDMENDVIALEVLSEIASDRILVYSLASGGWDSGNLIDQFYSNIEWVIEVANGKVEISDVKLTPPVNNDGEEDTDLEMVIEFSHNGQSHKWSFSRNCNDNFIVSFTKWAYSALDGNLLYFGDGPLAYYIPKELIKELETLGIKNEVSSLRSSNTINSKTAESIEKLFSNFSTAIHEEDSGLDEKMFLKLKEFAEKNEYLMPPVLERKSVSYQFVCIRPSSRKVIARTFMWLSEIVLHIARNYSELCETQTEALDLIIFDTFSGSIISPNKDGTWAIKDQN